MENLMTHFLEKWDCYISMAFGAFLLVTVKAANLQLTSILRYFTYVMIAVVIIDTLINIGEHESAFWKLTALLSNGAMLACCLIVLVAKFSLPLPLGQFAGLISEPSFMVKISLFIIIENAMWTYVYDHF